MKILSALVNKLLLISIVTVIFITACNSGGGGLQTEEEIGPSSDNCCTNGDVIFPQKNYQLKVGESLVVSFIYTYHKERPQETLVTQMSIKMESSIIKLIEPLANNKFWYKPIIPYGLDVHPGNQYYMNV